VFATVHLGVLTPKNCLKAQWMKQRSPETSSSPWHIINVPHISFWHFSTWSVCIFCSEKTRNDWVLWYPEFLGTPEFNFFKMIYILLIGWRRGLPLATLLLWKVLRATGGIFVFRTIPCVFATVTQLKHRLFIDRVLEFFSWKFVYFVRGFYGLVGTSS